MSIFDSIAQNNASPAQNKSAYEAPNPFLKAMNSQSKNDINNLGDLRVGSILKDRKIVSGSTANIINATLDYFLKDIGSSNIDMKMDFLPKTATTHRFIPIIFKTEHRYGQQPLYILFDSTPESLTFSKGAQWPEKSIQGRPEPVFTYASSSATTLSITGDFFVSHVREMHTKLKISDYLMSLAHPSKYHYMPSPITVMIGQWKVFRAIVTNVSIDYKGPWLVNSAQAAGERINDDGTRESIEGINPELKELPSHAPYIFTATISLSIVKEKNYVDFAEDIIKKGVMDDKEKITKEDMDNLSVAFQYYYVDENMQNDRTLKSNGVYESWTNMRTTYEFKDGVIVESTGAVDIKLNPNFNIFADANADRERADLAIITDTVNTQLTDIIGKNLKNAPIIGGLF